MKTVDLTIRILGSAAVGAGLMGSVSGLSPQDAVHLLFVLITYSWFHSLLKVIHD